MAVVLVTDLATERTLVLMQSRGSSLFTHLRLLEGDYNFPNGTQPVSYLEAKVSDPLWFSNLYRQVAGSDMTKVVDVPSLEEVCVC